jgi:phosphoglycerate dehydrogenase-like enzyme
VRSGLIHTPIVFTTARGIHARPLADFVVMAMLWFSKGGPQMLRQQRTHTWRRYCGRDLEQATVGIVGFGSIGRELAARCKQMGMRVLAAKRTPGQQDPADALVPLVDLARLLSESDFVVLAVPHTAETEGLIGRVQIAAMKPGAVIINLARGVVVDEPAMIEALRSEHLGGAALDVFAKEPLPADSPLWDLPNVLVCPHSASTLDSENAQLTELFCANLRRYFRGEPLINVFDKKRLY